ncbi:MAG: hypothetical protein IJW32_03955 [Clostridia bacterium]|nr:hypothetical protein [Clostridia bacterium]
MKRIYIFFIFAFVLSIYIYNYSSDKFYFLFKNYNDVEFCYVIDNVENKDICSTMQTNFNNLNFIKNGSKTLIRFKNSCKKLDFCAIDYFHASFVGNKNVLKEIVNKLNATQMFFEKYENKLVYYFYSNNFKKYKILKNKKINFQFVLENNFITVGYPMIYISF